MNLARFNELLLQSVGVGLAVLDAERLEILFCNRRFSEWFGEAATGSAITALIAGLDVAAMRESVASGGLFTAEHEVKVGRRTASLAVQVSTAERNGHSELIVECQNVSKIRELEYMIESYAQMVEKQNRTLRREKERAEKLLLNIMPKTVYEELKSFGVTAPQKFEQASVLLLDFVGFSEMAVSREPPALIAELNDIFTSFDRIVEQFGCERIKTMGDAYMAVSGVPETTPEHATNIAKVALLCLRYLERRNQTHTPKWQARIGINAGPVIGSIVGIQKYVYDIFGPGVNLAARMEALSGPMQVTLCEDMEPLITSEFRLKARGVEDIKGFGPKRIYTLEAGLEPLSFFTQ